MTRREMERLAQGLSDRLGYGQLRGVEMGSMTDAERGFSGAQVHRAIATCENGAARGMIFKEAPLKERMAMERLTAQGCRNTPTAFSLDLNTDAPRWMAQEDVGNATAPPSRANWIPEVAAALAGIHAPNLGKGDEMPWLPHADARYWREYLLTQISVDHFEAMMEENADFAREFGAYLAPLRKNAERFAGEMAALYAEGDCLTLTHGDLQTVDGAHVRDHSGRPCVIDFGWCHYAPFYIDLASFFGFDDARYYYDALRGYGITMGYADFDERLRAAFRYSGFIYLCPSVRQWASGPTERTGKRLLQMIRIILTGDFPERRIDYSQPLFARLLRAHAQNRLGAQNALRG